MQTHEAAAIWYDQRKAQLKLLKGMSLKSRIEGYSEGLQLSENERLVDTVRLIAKTVYIHPFPEIKLLNELPCVRAVGCWHSEVMVKVAEIVASVNDKEIADLSNTLISELIGPMPFTVDDTAAGGIH